MIHKTPQSTQLSIFSLCFIILAMSCVTHAEEIVYNRDIRPILSDRCFYCHGPDEEDRQADLRLDTAEGATEYAIVPGNAADSELMSRILSKDPELLMPPIDSGKELKPDEIQLIQKWIEQGAEYQPFWAYVPPAKSSLVDAKSGNISAEIDAFIDRKLSDDELTRSPPADPVTLLRRAYFDLIGLPPSPDEVDAFVADPSQEAYEQVIDRLLSSRHFGERLAIYWLDLVRYADTVGYHGDQDHNISPYRDWVINAINNNMPFDQFTREQLAGDLLPNPTIGQKVATGYNRLLQTSHEGGVQQKEYLAIYAADRVRNLSSVWMGATVGCAQCHNHKYDPYSIKDFYSLAAFFADVDEAQHFKLGSNQLPTRRPPEIDVLSESQQKRLTEIESLLSNQNQLRGERLNSLKKEKEEIQKKSRRTMVTVSIAPREMRVLPRGDWLDDSGEVVQPAVPEFLGQIYSNGERATRLDLANWLTDPVNGVGGLTARVQVNRYWYLLFGTGLSRSLDDFGGQGEPPSYPELLDHLAIEFIESGWDIKSLFKAIVLSQTYQQSSNLSKALFEKDPHNQFFARQGSYRLPAEIIRDNALLIAGLLQDDVGGDSSRPYQPDGYYRHLNFPVRKYQTDKDSNQYRRGVYVHWQRQFLHPMLKAFDAPSREECTAQRPRSNTPLAALVLMNDPTFVEAARSFAELILLQDLPNDESRLEFAFRKALSRVPDADESTILLSMLKSNLKKFESNPTAADDLLNVGLHTSDEALNTTDVAAWTTVTRTIFNLNESISRN